MVKFISPEQIDQVVCSHFNVSMEDIYRQDRNKNIVTARHFLVYLLSEEINMRTMEIASHVHRTHGIVTRSIYEIRDRVYTEKASAKHLMEMQFRIEQLRKNNCQDFWPVAS
jgi:chromosomal replication initiation ATPase DnaA